MLTMMGYATCTHAMSPRQIFERANESIVVIRTYDRNLAHAGMGSGVVFQPGFVATNCHVVEGAYLIRVGRKQRFIRADTVAGDIEKDLCLLQLEAELGKPSCLGEAGALNVGDDVYAIGAPDGLELSLSSGIVSQLRGPYPPMIQTTAPISPGSSGGGLFNSDGQLVGLTTKYLKHGQNINFAIPAEWIGELLTTIDRASDAPEAPEPQDPESDNSQDEVGESGHHDAPLLPSTPPLAEVSDEGVVPEANTESDDSPWSVPNETLPVVVNSDYLARDRDRAARRQNSVFSGGKPGYTSSGRRPVVDQDITPAEYAKNNPPFKYPVEAIRRDLQGAVVLRVMISPQGIPDKITVAQSSGQALLDMDAKDQVGKWRFVPARKNGEFVWSWLDVPINYRLSK